MKLRPVVIGLLAGMSMCVTGLAEEMSPSPEAPAAAESGSDSMSAAPGTATAEAASEAHQAPAAASAEGVAQSAEMQAGATEAGEGQSSSDGGSATAAEAAAAAVDIETEMAKPFDPNKAKPAEIAAYNANAEPDDRIVCRRDRESAGTGNRFSQKVCRTVRQWRLLGR